MRPIMTIRRVLLAAAFAASPSLALAQDEPPAGQTVGPPIQRITTASALSTEPLGNITSVRELPDGRILLNDGTRRRLLLMDTTLNLVEVVLDSLSEISNTYGTRPGALIPFRADTVLFIDPASYAIVVLDPAGKIVRVRSVWRVQDITYISSSTGTYGFPRADAQGRIVYRIPARPPTPVVISSDMPYYPQQPDSAFVVAVDLESRMLDTLGAIRIPVTRIEMRRTGGGGFTIESVMNPLPSSDGWAILPDGRVAFVRARDYRIDYLNPDGSWTSSEKLPYDWQRLTDEDKDRLVDSVRTVQQRSALNTYTSAVIRWVNQYAQDWPPGFTVPEGYTLTPGFGRDWILPPGLSFPENYIYACPPGVEPEMTALPIAVALAGAAPAAARGGPSCYPMNAAIVGRVTPPAPVPRRINIVPALELPDYRPPISASSSVRADEDGSLWIRTVPPRPVPGGIVYDIVSPEGQLVNRIQLPPGYAIVGFGRDRIVFLSVRDASGIHLARVRLR
jgi:hypothetical protein